MKVAKIGLISALLASACCLGPLLLVALGLSSGAVFLGHYHWFFMLGGLGVLGWAWTKYLREKASCACEIRPLNRGKAGLFSLLAATAVALGFVGLNLSRYVFAAKATQSQSQKTIAAGQSRAVIPVEGMSCATCEISVRSALGRVPGVKNAQVNFVSGTATVDYDPAQTGSDQLVTAINGTGYHANLPAK